MHACLFQADASSLAAAATQHLEVAASGCPASVFLCLLPLPTGAASGPVAPCTCSTARLTIGPSCTPGMRALAGTGQPAGWRGLSALPAGKRTTWCCPARPAAYAHLLGARSVHVCVMLSVHSGYALPTEHPSVISRLLRCRRDCIGCCLAGCAQLRLWRRLPAGSSASDRLAMLMASSTGHLKQAQRRHVRRARHATCAGPTVAAPQQTAASRIRAFLEQSSASCPAHTALPCAAQPGGRQAGSLAAPVQGPLPDFEAALRAGGRLRGADRACGALLCGRARQLGQRALRGAGVLHGRGRRPWRWRRPGRRLQGQAAQHCSSWGPRSAMGTAMVGRTGARSAACLPELAQRAPAPSAVGTEQHLPTPPCAPGWTGHSGRRQQPGQTWKNSCRRQARAEGRCAGSYLSMRSSRSASSLASARTWCGAQK